MTHPQPHGEILSPRLQGVSSARSGPPANPTLGLWASPARTNRDTMRAMPMGLDRADRAAAYDAGPRLQADWRARATQRRDFREAVEGVVATFSLWILPILPRN